MHISSVTHIPSLGVNQTGSTNFSRVLRTRVLRAVTFTQTPVQVRRKITFSAVTQNSSVRPYRFFKRTRAVLIYGRPASYRRIVCLVFAHGVQTWPRGARSHMTSRSHFIIIIQCTVFIQYSTLQGKTKKEGTDSLTLVNVFILYTHCHKYRIYFWDEVPTTKSQGWVPTKHTTVLQYICVCVVCGTVQYSSR